MLVCAYDSEVCEIIIKVYVMTNMSSNCLVRSVRYSMFVLY